MAGHFHLAVCVFTVAVVLSCHTGYTSGAQGLPLRLLGTTIDTIDVDAFEFHEQPGAESVENFTTFIGSRIILRFNKPFQLGVAAGPGKTSVSATATNLSCAEDGRGSSQTLVHPWTETPASSIASVPFFATKRQFDSAISPHLACITHDDARGTPSLIAATESRPLSRIPSALRRVFHLVNAFGDLNRSPSALELIVYIVNLRVGTVLERNSSRHSRDAASFAVSPELLLKVGLLHFGAIVSTLWQDRDAGHGVTDGQGGETAIQCTMWGAIPAAVDSISLTSHNSVQVAALPEPAISFFFPTICSHAPDRERDVPTVELPHGACIFLEEGSNSNDPPAGQGPHFEPYAAATAAAISVAEQQMDAVDAERASAMANLVERINNQRGHGASREHVKVNVTADVLRDASETIPRLLQAAISQAIPTTAHAQVGAVQTSLLAVDSGATAGDLTQATTSGRSVLTDTGQYLSALELGDLMHTQLPGIMLVIAPIMVLISAAMGPMMDEIVESTAERVSQNVKNSVGAFVPTDTAKIASAAMTYQLSGILPDMVTAILAPAMSKRLVDQLSPYA
eukprot:INCI17237.2.p1 GENE.INCI17237.2~~INCI17237.2.p1  ORF type:complete len:570 (-),score=81.81 INCI17237.2:1191-2900(-)